MHLYCILVFAIFMATETYNTSKQKNTLQTYINIMFLV